MTINITAAIPNTTNATSLPYVFTYSWALPYVAIGLIVLVMGIAAARSKRSDTTLISGLVASLFFYSFWPSADLLGTAAIIGLLSALAVGERMVIGRKQKNIDKPMV
jgi:hypothetical protein